MQLTRHKNMLKRREYYSYTVLNDRYSITLSIVNYKYRRSARLEWCDFTTKRIRQIKRMQYTRTTEEPVKLKEEDRNLIFRDNQLEISFLTNGIERQITCKAIEFENKKDLICQFQFKNEDKILLHTAVEHEPKAQQLPFKKEISEVVTTGYVRYNDRLYKFRPKESMGIFQYVIGEKTNKNKGYSGVIAGEVSGNRFGVYLQEDIPNGVGTFYYEGAYHPMPKLQSISTQEDEDKISLEWKTMDQRFRLTVDEITLMKPFFFKIKGIQSFGKYRGFIKLRDGRKLEICDLMGIIQREA